MSLISRLWDSLVGSTAIPPRVSASGLPFWGVDDPALADFMRDGAASSAGVIVNEKMALRNSAIYRATNLISSSLAMLGVPLYENVIVQSKDDEGNAVETKGAKKATDHAVYRLLVKRPNNFQTPFEFWTYMIQRAQFDGIAYAVKKWKVSATTRGGRKLDQLVPLDPKKVTAKLNDNFEMTFMYAGPNGQKPIAADDMFWFRSPVSSDGITGAKLLDVARETIALAHQVEKANGNVMKNGAIVGGVLEHPKSLDDPAIERLRAQFEARQSSPENAGKWIVAEDGLKATPFGTTLKDAESADMRRFQIEEIGRFTNVPRPLLFLDETSWGSGIEQLGLFFITYCLLPWFVNIEQAISRSLLSEEEADKYYAKFQDGALLRGSLSDQAAFFSKALGSGGGKGWMTQNEVRDKMELNPKEGGNDLPQPISKGTGDGSTDPEGQGADAEGSPPADPKPKKPDRRSKE